MSCGKLYQNVTNRELPVPAHGARGVKSRKIKAFPAIRVKDGADMVEINGTFPFCGHFSTG